MAIDRSEAINRFGRSSSISRITQPSVYKNGVTVKVDGIDDLKRALAGLSNKIRRKVLVKALRAGARVVQRAARANIPVMSTSNPYRTKGLLKRRLTVRVSKESRKRGDVGVFVNIKPAKGGEKGTKSRVDPYYWRWVAFGAAPHKITTKVGKLLRFGNLYRKSVNHPGIRGYNFLDDGAAALPAALIAFEREAIPAIEALNRPGA